MATPPEIPPAEALAGHRRTPLMAAMLSLVLLLTAFVTHHQLQVERFNREVVRVGNLAGQSTKGGLQGSRQADDPGLTELQQAFSRRVWLGVAFLLIGIGLWMWLVMRSILRPIGNLTAAAGTFAEGRLDYRVPEMRRGRMGRLAASLNRMAAQLQAYRRLQDEKIVRLHQFMESTLGAFPDPVFIFNEQGAVEMQNPAARRWLRETGQNGRLPESIESLWRRALHEGEDVLPQGFAEVLTCRVGGRRQVYLPRALRIEHEHVVSGVALVLHDITRFQLLDELKTNLIGTVSHEIKTPLTSVSMVLHLLEEETPGKLSDQQRELVTTAIQDTGRLLAVTQDLLDLSRLEAGRAALDLEETGIGPLFAQASEPLAPLIEEREQQLRLTVADGLPPLQVDFARMSHVIRNLLENAVKYSPPGTTIELEAGMGPDGAVRLSVRDEGPGVPEEFRDRIFEKFFRLRESEAPGTGLGLSICREIVAAHGGRLETCNREGGGAEFTVLLPMRKHEQPEEHARTDSGGG
ncbi:MAG TPA: hypothetical protein DCY13_04425 [Verrucomicrobiales bacterium]|nr:hypothetical protein [Verrucomicrobiales bacterium]